jgi:hypothetical protein
MSCWARKCVRLLGLPVCQRVIDTLHLLSARPGQPSATIGFRDHGAGICTRKVLGCVWCWAHARIRAGPHLCSIYQRLRHYSLLVCCMTDHFHVQAACMCAFSCVDRPSSSRPLSCPLLSCVLSCTALHCSCRAAAAPSAVELFPEGFGLFPEGFEETACAGCSNQSSEPLLYCTSSPLG